jgi:hypothetical protein
MIRRAGPMACALALGAVGGVLLGGCGGATKTVTVSGAPAANAGAQAGAHTSSTASTASTPAGATTTTGASGASGAAGQPTSTTRTAPAPAFLHSGGQSAEQAASAQATAAAAVVSAHGYTAGSLADYHPNQTLRVLIGTRGGSTDGYNQLAFFFLGNHYLGTDSSQPSAAVHVVSQSDTEVTLAYALYRPHDTLCCPSGGQAVVHFQLDNGTLTPLNPIPSASSSSGLSRQ